MQLACSSAGGVIQQHSLSVQLMLAHSHHQRRCQGLTRFVRLRCRCRSPSLGPHQLTASTQPDTLLPAGSTEWHAGPSKTASAFGHTSSTHTATWWLGHLNTGKCGGACVTSVVNQTLCKAADHSTPPLLAARHTCKSASSCEVLMAPHSSACWGCCCCASTADTASGRGPLGSGSNLQHPDLQSMPSSKEGSNGVLQGACTGMPGACSCWHKELSATSTCVISYPAYPRSLQLVAAQESMP